MEKIFTYTTRSPYYNKPFIQEKWRRVEHPYIPYADGPVWVSTLGRIWNENKCQIIIPWTSKSKTAKDRLNPFIDYKCIINGEIKYKKMLVCRLIMLLFDPIPNPESFTVNHGDGNTMNNCIYNLSWCPNRDNIRLAYMNRQMSYHDKDGNKIAKELLQPEKIDQICKLILQGLDYTTIANMVGVTYQKVHSIAIGRTYKEEGYLKYHLDQVESPTRGYTKELSNENLQLACQMIYDGCNYDRIAETVGCSRQTVRKIKNGYSYKGAYDAYVQERERGDNNSN